MKKSRTARKAADSKRNYGLNVYQSVNGFPSSDTSGKESFELCCAMNELSFQDEQNHFNEQDITTPDEVDSLYLQPEPNFRDSSYLLQERQHSNSICLYSESTSEVGADLSWLYNKVEYFKGNKLCREVSRSVPSGILPAGVDGVMSDFSINAKSSDDDIYLRNEELRVCIPRGFSVFGLSNKDGSISRDVVIYANRKFFAGDTECQSKTSTNVSIAFIENIQCAKYIVAMEKINGEAAHFSGRYIDGDFYFIAGSKNVHILFKNESHINKYTEERYQFAKLIAYSLLEKWRSLTEDSRESLKKYLVKTSSTVVCELLIPNRQHVVHFADHSFTHKLIVLCSTPPPSENVTSLTNMPVSECLDYFSSLGFEVAQHEVLSPGDFSSHSARTRSKLNSEGVVYYYTNSRGDTIGLLKFKSVWYVHLRALRQQASHRYRPNAGVDRSLEWAKLRSRRRMEQLQTWLFTSDEQLHSWQQLSDRWLDWLEQLHRQDRLCRVSLRENFPSVWKDFTDAADLDVDLKALLV